MPVAYYATTTVSANIATLPPPLPPATYTLVSSITTAPSSYYQSTTTKTLLPFLFPRFRFLVIGVEKLRCHIVPYLTYSYENNGSVSLKKTCYTFSYLAFMYFQQLQYRFCNCISFFFKTRKVFHSRTPCP